jgi:hypothetical protein
MNLGDIFLNLSRLEDARLAYEDLIAFASRYHVFGFESAARERLVLIHWLRGEWDIALVADRALRESGFLLAGLTRVWHGATTGMIHNDLGQPLRARDELDALLPDALRNDELQTTIPFLTQLARASVLNGEPEAGRIAVDGMLQRMDAIPFFDGSCGPALLEIAYWYAAAEGQAGAAAALGCLERLQRLVKQVRPVDGEAMLDELQAVVSSLRGDTRAAAASFASAAAGWSALQRPYSMARAMASHGQALIVLGRLPEALPVFREAETILDGLNAKLNEPMIRESFGRNGLLAVVRSRNTADV